jgi:predicted RNA-binding protein with PUA-like domain
LFLILNEKKLEKSIKPPIFCGFDTHNVISKPNILFIFECKKSLEQMNYWLVKTEPEAYSWDDMEKEGRAIWDGVRNYAARNHLQAMKLDDWVLFYHSVSDKKLVGYAKVIKEAYPDPTTDDNRWVVVELAPMMKFAKPITLAQVKADVRLQNMALVRISRLSVSPVTQAEFNIILELATE